MTNIHAMMTSSSSSPLHHATSSGSSTPGAAKESSIWQASHSSSNSNASYSHSNSIDLESSQNFHANFPMNSSKENEKKMWLRLMEMQLMMLTKIENDVKFQEISVESSALQYVRKKFFFFFFS